MKTKKLAKSYGIRISEEDYEALVSLAVERGTNRNRLLNLAIERLLAEELPKIKPEKTNTPEAA